MTRTLRVSAESPDPAAIAETVAVLRAGGVVAYPTDTLYGLAVDPWNDDATARLFAVKGRDLAVAVPLIAGDLAQAESAGSFGDGERQLARTWWPGPLSIVVPADARVSPRLLAGGGTVAVRVPDHPLARALATGLGRCITATSANPSGEAAVARADHIAPLLRAQLDLVLDGGAAPGGAPSTIVQIADGRPRLIRDGAIPWERVLESLQ